MLALIAFALVALATLTWMSLAWRVSMPHNRMPFIAAWSLGALLGSIVLVSGAPGTGMAIAALLLGGTLLLLTASGAQRAGNDIITVGDAMPAFTASDEHGNPVSSERFAGNLLLLKFFRGHW